MSLAAGLTALLLPLAAGVSAQTSLRWDSSLADGAALGNGSVYSPRATMARVFPGNGLQLMPLAAGFNVPELETLAQNLVADQKVPGLAMAIVHQGRILSARGYGVTDVDNPEPVDEHTVFRLASLSKSFAATATGLLVNQGRLRWDSRIVDYYPTLQFSEPRAALELTVADVLSHRVGLGHNAFDRDIEGNAEYASLVRKMAYTPMQCAPGECYAYQNVAYSLIGDVIGGASGEPFERWVSERLFAPLGIAYIVSILASLLVSLTVTPVLSYYLLPQAQATHEHDDSPLLRFLKWLVTPVIQFSMKFAGTLLLATWVLVAVGAWLLTQIGSDFLPQFDEGSVQVNITLPSGSSLQASNEYAATVDAAFRAMQKSAKNPNGEVLQFSRRTGRAENDEESDPVNVTEFILTINADAHPIMSRMHKPDPKLGPDQQDKRSVVPIEMDDVDAWLNGSQEAAAALVRLAPAQVFDAGPVAP